MVPFRVVVCFAVLAAAVATNVDQCPGQEIKNLNENVQLSPCKKAPCRLKKGTNQSITIVFTPDKDIPEIKNHVTANVFGLDLSFIGVDGFPICEKIYLENGEKASCPLKAGTKYMYKDSFPILAIYPSIPLKVHWELKDGENVFVCFEMQARIS